VSDADSVRRSVDFALERFGRLDLAVNNAGIGGGDAPVADYGLDDWDKVVGVNLSGVFYGLNTRFRHFLAPAAGRS
jgi:NAD(P)-dependent dehydrogenase (short-subunit alcohol dehydrogenase family)